MAIFYFAVQNLRRADGRNAIAAAAYRSGEKLYSTDRSKAFDYSKKRGVLGKGLIGFEGSRQELWSCAEKSENRKNSVVAREVILALPHEMTDDERQQLVEMFCSWLRSRHGFALDWAVHTPAQLGDRRNYHAHILMTTRQVSNEVFGKKTRELDQRNTSGKHIEEWRRQWASYCNRLLGSIPGCELLDYRSYSRQAEQCGSKPKTPQRHLGPAITNILRKTEKSMVHPVQVGPETIHPKQHSVCSRVETAERQPLKASYAR
ncbi:MobA/MobL family protein [Terasakiella pusilla]|uniref:MobA/MobL family protein n=1 Tax=Terasakiella pusilla TaxID=64973 RepID=UPI003AA97E5B